MGLNPFCPKLALAGFEALMRLVDDVDAPFAPDNAVVAVARA